MFVQQQHQAKRGNDWCLQKERRWNSLLQPGLISAEGGDCGIQTFPSSQASGCFNGYQKWHFQWPPKKLKTLDTTTNTKCGCNWCVQKAETVEYKHSLLQLSPSWAPGCCSSSISIVFAAGISGSAFMEPIKIILWKHNSKIQIFAFGDVRKYLSCKESPCPTFPNQNHSQHWHESTHEIVSWLTCFWDVSYLLKYKYKCVNKYTYKHVYKYKHNLNINAD